MFTQYVTTLSDETKYLLVIDLSQALRDYNFIYNKNIILFSDNVYNVVLEIESSYEGLGFHIKITDYYHRPLFKKPLM